MRATELYDLGYTDLVSVIPPNATLHPDSKIAPDARGKAPGIKSPISGLWGGYPWSDTAPLRANAERMERDGANVGLLAKRFPGIDIDILDEPMADAVATIIERELGAACPMRVGKWPKRLFPCKLEGEPFGRMQLWIESDGRHCVEILGDGQQYLVAGIHPGTMHEYEWRSPLKAPALLPLLSRDRAEALLNQTAELLDMFGFECKRIGDGRIVQRLAVDQESLKAPNRDVLIEVMRRMPNTNEHFASRDAYIRFGHALKAATADDPGLGLELWLDWCDKWEGNEHGVNKGEVVAADWDRMRPPFSIGADYLFAVARECGIDTARYEFAFDPFNRTTETETHVDPIRYSDDWLADRFTIEHGLHVRYVPEQEQWLAWNDSIWEPDRNKAFELIRKTCREVADQLGREGSTALEKRQNVQLAARLSSVRQIEAVSRIARYDPRTIIHANDLDVEPELLATPGGFIDLRTGKLSDADPQHFITRSTSATPAPMPTPKWDRFLLEMMGGNSEAVASLQTVVGYSLTGHTYEHKLFYFWGPGGNGKGVFMGVMTAAFGTYARAAAMNIFLASRYERHSTDIAALNGPRLVIAQEIREGQDWNTQLLKQLSGGDPISARYMRRDNFTFQPKCKLWLAGNSRPGFDVVDDGMKRRLVLFPFVQKPAVVIPDLKEQLIAQELPGILHWGIVGSQIYLRDGLRLPKCVQEATTEYFTDEDQIGRMLAATCVRDQGELAASALYQAVSQWCLDNSEPSITQKKLGDAMTSRGFKKKRDNVGRVVYLGLKLVNGDGPSEVL